MGSKVVFNSVMGTDFGLEVMKEKSERLETLHHMYVIMGNIEDVFHHSVFCR